MDWDSGQPDFTDHDTSNFNFYFDQECLVVRQYGWEDEELPSIRKIKGKLEWEAWLEYEREIIDDATQPCFYAVICTRGPEIFPGQPSPISDLPFGRNVWSRLVRTLRVDRSITRVIARNVAHFSAVRRNEGKEKTVSYSTRMSTSLPADLAISTTFIPAKRHTYSVVYGCNSTQLRGIERRLRSAGRYMSHPLLLAGIFAELERERLIAAVDALVDKFALTSSITEQAKWDPTSTQIRDYFTTCIQSRNLADQVKAVKRQLVPFIEELAVLENQFHEELKYVRVGVDNDMAEAGKQRLLNALETGQRIRRRLSDISVEYDDKIDECEMMAQNLPLAMQTVWNQTSRQEFIINTRIAKANNAIALETKRESTQMRSIALLTMVYLPMSCVASIFSTSLFNFSPGEGESVVSRYIWVLVGLSLGLTAVTMLIWHFTTNRESRREAARRDIKLDDMV
ncbi:hypothetical protein QBC34DRAFT_409826 [Podospora aff. communis PSN243]|uniref:Uncharacterized protein n=1 Tax=Podospora aff. communis PSN243 TaxID=3040156 RepID=A0AAV9GES4_9PEZI|nr:hypothetical protein QBC34DRAFT_409826 [Podospora aff. communis PSN243]